MVNKSEGLLASFEAAAKEAETFLKTRVATEDDIPHLETLINNAYRYENEGDKAFKTQDALRIDPERLKHAMDEGVMIVVENPEHSEIIGCVQYKEFDATEGSGPGEVHGYFGLLAVSPDQQGNAYGTALVRLVERIATLSKRETMEIQVIHHSEHLLDWYRRLGYTEFGTKVLEDPSIIKPTHFILMSKQLAPLAPSNPFDFYKRIV